MKRKKLVSIVLATLTVLIVSSGAMAREMIGPICTGCHQADGKTIWGELVPGSQEDGAFQVRAGKDVWSVRYDRNSKLNKLATVRDLADEKAVKVRFRGEGENQVYAEEMSYKSNYGFKNPEDIITISEVVELLKESPEKGNYVIFDSRGYDNYIEGHLPEAVLLPHYQFQSFKSRMPANKNTLIVAYCRGYG